MAEKFDLMAILSDKGGNLLSVFQEHIPSLDGVWDFFKGDFFQKISNIFGFEMGFDENTSQAPQTDELVKNIDQVSVEEENTVDKNTVEQNISEENAPVSSAREILSGAKSEIAEIFNTICEGADKGLLARIEKVSESINSIEIEEGLTGEFMDISGPNHVKFGDANGLLQAVEAITSNESTSTELKAAFVVDALDQYSTEAPVIHG